MLFFAERQERLMTEGGKPQTLEDPLVEVDVVYVVYV